MNVRPVVLAAGVGARMGALTADRPKALVEVAGKPILLHHADLYRAEGLAPVVVGGHAIEKVRALGLPTFENPEYAVTNMVWSLRAALDDWEGEVIVSYGDIVFGPTVLRALLAEPARDAVVVDELWADYWKARFDDPFADAESLVLDEAGHITDIGRSRPAPADVHAQYTGLFRLSAQTVAEVKRRVDADPARYRKAFMTDLLRDLIAAGTRLKAVRVRRGWYEFDNPTDLAYFEGIAARKGAEGALAQEPGAFAFASKAQTLARVAPLVKTASVPAFCSFTVDEWRKDPRARAAQARALGAGPLVVRSSAAVEDAATASMAGAFLSVLGVSPADEPGFAAAVERVIASYGAHAQPANDRVLVQRQVQDVVMSGVMLTRDPAGGPYLCINYDDTTSSTDRVTAGLESKTVYVARSAARVEDEALARLVRLARELEGVTGNAALDVEFALDGAGALHLLQVRPIAAPSDTTYDGAVRREMDDIKSFLADRMRRLPSAHGRSTIFGIMPDWNPAEIIGTRPRPLAHSVYRYVITDHAWREARERIGYFEPFPERLMVSLGGCPYIDVRASFNSLLPAGLRVDLRNQLVDHYLDHLRANPAFHDKVEFEVAITCLTLDFPRHSQRLREHGFDNGEIGELRQGLLFLTERVVTEGGARIRNELDLVRRMEPRRLALLAEPPTVASIPRQVSALLEDCIRHGTLPFAILARYAFIGTALLRSLVVRGLVRQEDADAFMAGIRTVTTGMMEDHAAMSKGALPRDAFLAKYGHLRPGTYDILSPRYDERPDLYFGEMGAPPAQRHEARFDLDDARWRAIDEHLDVAGFSFSAATLFDFVARAVEARELAKFEFTKNLSAALTLLERYGRMKGFSAEDMSYVPIREFLRLDAESPPLNVDGWLRTVIAEGRERSEIAKRLQLPPLVVSPEDVDVVRVPESRPNFVTQRRVVAPAFRLVPEALASSPDLAGKIVLIENADPGFDWVFTRDIAGLVTKYGGVASHMAIRCAELNLPAAVGCGATFDRLVDAGVIDLDAGARRVSRVD